MTQKQLNEAVGEDQYKAEVILETSTEQNVTDILTKIRALEGVTIITIRNAHVKMSNQIYKSFLTIKYVPPRGVSNLLYLRRLHWDIMAIKGCKSFLIIKSEKMEEYVPFEKKKRF